MNDRLYGIVKSATKIVREIEFLSQFKLSQVWPVPINFKSISKMRLTKTRLSNPLKTAVLRNTNESWAEPENKSRLLVDSAKQ